MTTIPGSDSTTVEALLTGADEARRETEDEARPAWRELTEVISDGCLRDERRLLALEARAERDGFASVKLWPARFPDFALEITKGSGGMIYGQTGSAPQTITRVYALGLLRFFPDALKRDIARIETEARHR